MAENNLDPEQMRLLNDTLNETVHSLLMLSANLGGTGSSSARLRTSLDGNTGAVSKNTTAHFKSWEEINRTSNLFHNLGDNILSLGTAALSTGTTLSKFSGTVDSVGKTFSRFANTFGLTGKVIGLAIDAYTTVTKRSLEYGDSILAAKDDLASFGAAGKYTSDEIMTFGKQAGYTSFTLKGWATATKSLGTDIIGLSATVNGGVAEFAKLSEITMEQRKNYQAMGISQEQLTQNQADYVKLQTASGKIITEQMKRDGSLKKASLEYTENLVQLSAITGLGIEQAKKVKEQASASFDIQIKTRQQELEIADLKKSGTADDLAKADSIRKEIDAREKLLTAVAATGDAELLAAAQSRMATGAYTDVSKRILMVLPGFDDLAEATKRGEDVIAKFNTQLSQGINQNVRTIGATAMFDKNTATLFSLTKELMAWSAKITGKDQQQAKKESTATTKAAVAGETAARRGDNAQQVKEGVMDITQTAQAELDKFSKDQIANVAKFVGLIQAQEAAIKKLTEGVEDAVTALGGLITKINDRWGPTGVIVAGVTAVVGLKIAEVLGTKLLGKVASSIPAAGEAIVNIFKKAPAGVATPAYRPGQFNVPGGIPTGGPTSTIPTATPVPQTPTPTTATPAATRPGIGAKGIGALAIGGVVGDIAGSALKESGHEKLGAGASILGSTASYAAMGSLLGPWGTALGAIAGLAKGTYENWDDLTGKVKDVTKVEGDGKDVTVKLNGSFVEMTKVTLAFTKALKEASDSLTALVSGGTTPTGASTATGGTGTTMAPNGSGAGRGRVSSDLRSTIAGRESGGAGYDAIYGHSELGGDASITAAHGEKSLSQLPISEVMKIQQERAASNRGAAGKYQFMPKTLVGLLTAAGLSPTDPFNAENQEKLYDVFVKQNADYLKDHGVEPNDANLSLAHAVGAKGAILLLTADKNKNALDVLGIKSKAGRETNQHLDKPISQYLADIQAGVAPLGAANPTAGTPTAQAKVRDPAIDLAKAKHPVKITIPKAEEATGESTAETDRLSRIKKPAKNFYGAEAIAERAAAAKERAARDDAESAAADAKKKEDQAEENRKFAEQRAALKVAIAAGEANRGLAKAPADIDPNTLLPRTQKLAKGGIVSNTSSGSMVTLGDGPPGHKEAAIPLDPSSIVHKLIQPGSAETLNKAADTMPIPTPASAPISDMSSGLTVEMVEMLSQKLDTMIDKLSSGNDTQEKLLMYSRS